MTEIMQITASQYNILIAVWQCVYSYCNSHHSATAVVV